MFDEVFVNAGVYLKPGMQGLYTQRVVAHISSLMTRAQAVQGIFGRKTLNTSSGSWDFVDL